MRLRFDYISLLVNFHCSYLKFILLFFIFIGYGFIHDIPFAFFFSFSLDMGEVFILEFILLVLRISLHEWERIKCMFGTLNENYNMNNNFLLLRIKYVVIERLNIHTRWFIYTYIYTHKCMFGILNENCNMNINFYC